MVSMTLTAPRAGPETGAAQPDTFPGSDRSGDGGSGVLAALRKALDARWWILSGGRFSAAVDAVILHPEFGVGLVAPLADDGAAPHPAAREIRSALAADGLAARFGGFLPVIGIALDPGDACPENLPDRIARAFAAAPTIGIRDPRWVEWAAASLSRLKPAPQPWASHDRSAPCRVAQRRRQPRNRAFAGLMLAGIASASGFVVLTGTGLHRLPEIAADSIVPAAETTTAATATAAPPASFPTSRPGGGGAVTNEAPPQRAPAAASAAPMGSPPQPPAARAAATATGSPSSRQQPAESVQHPAPRLSPKPQRPHINENQP
jgi:hypothetical protein